MRRHYLINIRCWILPIVAVLIQGCMGPFDHLSWAIQEQLEGGPHHWPAISRNRGQLQEFYQQRDYRPLWIVKHSPMPRAAELLSSLTAASEEGLDPNCYDIEVIKKLWSVKKTTALAKLELLLTNAFINYSDDVRNGLLQPNERNPNWRADQGRIGALPLLTKLLASHNFAARLRALPPPQKGYQDLRKALYRYQQWANYGGWPDIPAGPTLRQGQRHSQVALLRQRLILEDSRLPLSNDITLFDRALHDAVQRFQQRHGLEAQGLVGADTRRAMNTPITERIKQIKANMDRWRWLPRELENDYIMVNTAAYQLTAYVDKAPYLAMRVITGKPARPSPIVGGKLVQVIINPDWIVPRTIVVEDIIPMQQVDADYLSRKKIRIFTNLKAERKEINPADLDWLSFDKVTFPYTLVQDPGEDNSLGRMKFVFLNDFAVFLHDTPIRELFGQNKRAFSSGCIRVEKPKELATFLLGEDSGWDDERFEQSIEEGFTEKVQMARAIPVFLVYWTAWVGADQGVNFREDIYKWDRILGKCA